MFSFNQTYSKFEKDFNKSHRRIKFGVIAMFIIIGLFFLFYANMASKYKYMVQEQSISYGYNNNAPQSHFCNEYKEENGCIIFTDELGNGQKICGQYKVVTLNKSN